MTNSTIFDTAADHTIIEEQSLTSINFDENTLAAGTIITNQFEGVEFSSSSEFGVMIFDSSNVTGADFDLAATDLDNVLIISEDGDSNDPDDHAAGGTISLEFDELVEVDNIGLLDIDESGGSITFYDNDSHLIETVEIDDLGDNSFQEINLDVADVARLEINLAGSGAVTSIDYKRGQVSPYSNIYVFGDSLSDPGNIFNVTTFLQQSPELLTLDIPITPLSPPYFEGRFSNGPVWVEQLAEDLGITLTPSTELSVVSPETNILSSVTVIDDNPLISPFFNGRTTSQSVNFAFGGAQTGANGSGEFGSLIPGLQQQVDWFVNDHLQALETADPDALYILWAGRNDYNELNINPEPTIDNLEAEIETLYELGARNFLVPNLPDLAQIPVSLNPDSPIPPETLTELSNAHNFLLDTTIDELRDSLTGANLVVLNINSLFDDVITNPEDYGLTNTTDSYLDLTTFMPATDESPDEYLFFDALHPTVVGHEIVNDFALSTLGIESDVVV